MPESVQKPAKDRYIPGHFHAKYVVFKYRVMT